MEENLKSQASEVREALSSRISKILGNSSEMGVLKDGQVVTKLLHKARMRISVHLQICLATPDHTTFTDTSISEYEIDRAALTIAHAMVNPRSTCLNRIGMGQQPLNRKGSRSTSLRQCSAKFQLRPPLWTGMAESRCLRDSLLDTLPPISDQKKSWRDDGFVLPEGGGEFGADPLVMSESYNSKKVQQWLGALTTSELLWNSITAAVAPDLFESGSSAFSKVVKEVRRRKKNSAPVDSWPSIFSGLEIIANRTTFSHRDPGGSPSLFDLLVSLGRNHHATLSLADVHAELDYSPGAMVYIAGRVLEHSTLDFMSSQITLRNRKRVRVQPSSSGTGPSKRKRGAYKYAYIPSKTRRGKDSWKEANASFVYEDSDSEIEVASPSKQIRHHHIEDHIPLEYNREVHGDFWMGGLDGMKRKTKAQNDFLRDYLPWRTEYLSVLLDLEQLVNNGKCNDCGEGEGLIRCLSCSGTRAWCPSCVLKAHQHNPFHNLQLWNGRFYETTTLQAQGYIMYLGHGGEPCPNLSHQPDPSPWEDLGSMEDVFAQEEGDTINDTQLGVSNLVIVHSTGVYSHSVSWCQCPGAEKAHHLDLMKARLFPASLTRPQSAFTFDVLDNFLIDALECKTSAMSFYQKLRRFTNNAFPDKIPDKKDRYRELMRVSRIWRDLVNRKRFGFGHDTEQSPGPGDLALYCPACPQPGINLPTSWRYDYEDMSLIIAQHMKMKIPEDDVSLADGKGYMWWTSKMESVRHMNMDYSICNAVKYTPEPIGSTLIIYDVACQWSIHFAERVDQSYHLSLPEGTKILPAVGKFHLSAHKLQCFARFSLNFMTRAGHIDGEILETLWAPFNKISPTARSMSLAHRKEVLDDHMRDSNWKKLGISDTQGPYEELTRSLDLDDVQEWKKAAEKAAQDRGELLDIYQLKMDKAPSMAEIRLRLTENELSANGRTGSVAWLIEGINIENSQDALRLSIRQLPQDLTASQRTGIEEKRQKLMAQIIKFHEAAEVMTNGMELKGGEGAPLDNPELCLEEADISNMEDPEEEDILDFDGNIDSPAEVTEIWMPSWAASGHIMDDVVLTLRQEELELQKGQANDCLEKLRQALGDRSVVFREKIHSNKSVHHQGTRSKKELQTITLSINRHARGYSRARAAMLCLGADSDTVAVYQPLKPQDLVEDSQKNVWMNEFYRVNWLKAKARYDHWSEELKLVQYEMFWTISWFRTQEERWRVRADESIKNGNRAYAERQASMWAEFSAQGLKNFEGKLLITS
ncbi:uncharacterized protein EDB91DRAFT_1081059 [Suillus paluster]|uniref:uncharacterized protein n=1 Tax=Suillus paluster TaxID=48578 RepID=UPI001B86E120|nr:uncharacterized protein EDB91DRAFT_1081059 [Suillus paluster]KAG1743676.1 hypothetical protein EDB91DRAFT_1081059 [Suillus paluster]